MKKKRRGISCIVTCAFLAMSMFTGSRVQAADLSVQKADITVQGIEAGARVSVYPMISVNVNANGQVEYPMYQWEDEVAVWLKKPEQSAYTAYLAKDGSVTDKFTKAAEQEDSSFKSFWHDVAAAIKTGEISFAADAVKTKTAVGETLLFPDMPMGEYLLLAQGEVIEKMYLPSTADITPKYKNNAWAVEDAFVTMKADTLSVEKEVTDPSKQQAAIGDIVPYRITTRIPSYPENLPAATAYVFQIRDRFSKGLTFQQDIKVYVGDESVSEEGNYALSEDQNSTFILAFASDFVKNNAGEKVVVTYSAMVNENAFEEDALGNQAFIGFNNDPYDEDSYKEIPTEETIYTYGIQIIKENKDGAKLSGAVFTLNKQMGEAMRFINEEDGVYRLAMSNETGASTALVTGKEGTLLLKGLAVGSYTLKEVEAPDGYVLPKGEITIVLTDDDLDGALDERRIAISGDAEVKEKETALANAKIISVTVENTSKEDAQLTLPTTGGIGTALFTIGGMVLMGSGALLLLFLKKRKA